MVDLHFRSIPGEKIHKFGYNADIGTSFEPIWGEGGAFTWPSSAGVGMSVASSSALDTAAGTGARTVRVEGIKATGAKFSEDVTLNGTTEVALTNTDAIAINRAYVLTAGSGGVNAGDIYVGDGTFTAGVPAEIFNKILAGYGQSLHGLYSSPTGRSLYLASYNFFGARSGTTDVDLEIRFRIARGPWRTIMAMPSSQIQLFSNYAFPVKLGDGQCDVEARAKVSTGTDPVGVEMCFIEAD